MKKHKSFQNLKYDWAKYDNYRISHHPALTSSHLADLSVISLSYSSCSCWSLWGTYSLQTLRASCHIPDSYRQAKHSYNVTVKKLSFRIPRRMMNQMTGHILFNGSHPSSDVYITINFTFLTTNKMCLWNTMPPRQQSLKRLYKHKCHSHGHKVINLGVIRKGNISEVCMPNMKSLSLTDQKL